MLFSKSCKYVYMTHVSTADWSDVMMSWNARWQCCGSVWSSRSAAKVWRRSRYATWREPKLMLTDETVLYRERWSCSLRCTERSGRRVEMEEEGVSEDGPTGLEGEWVGKVWCDPDNCSMGSKRIIYNSKLNTKTELGGQMVGCWLLSTVYTLVYLKSTCSPKGVLQGKGGVL